MLVLPGGRERTEEQYAALFAAAGLRLTRVVDTPTRMSVLEGRVDRIGLTRPLRAARARSRRDSVSMPIRIAARMVGSQVGSSAMAPARSRNASSATCGNIPNISPNTMSMPPPASRGTSSRKRSA